MGCTWAHSIEAHAKFGPKSPCSRWFRLREVRQGADISSAAGSTPLPSTPRCSYRHKIVCSQSFAACSFHFHEVRQRALAVVESPHAARRWWSPPPNRAWAPRPWLRVVRRIKLQIWSGVKIWILTERDMQTQRIKLFYIPFWVLMRNISLEASQCSSLLFGSGAYAVF